MAGRNIYVCDGKIIDGTITGIKKSVKDPNTISEEDFNAFCEQIKDCLLYIEGVEESSYDNSDDDRAGCYRSRYPFGYYYELDPLADSRHLLRIDGEIRGVVFHVTRGYHDVDYYAFLFDGSIQQEICLGYSASHSSNFIYIQKVSLVKKGENGAPNSARSISFKKSRSDTSI